MKGKLSSLGLFLALVSMASASQSYAEIPSYRFTDLGTLGGTESSANAINNAGVVAGWARTATGAIHATVWNGTKAMDLGTLGGTYSMAHDINDLGQVVGEASITGTTAYATRWDGTRPTRLGASDVVQSSANAINNGGQVVGWTQTLEEVSQGGSHATSWSGANTTRLGSPDGFQSSAEDINDAGQIVGSDAFTATLWNGTKATQLGPALSYANAINSSGQIAGGYTVGSYDPFIQITHRATVWAGSGAGDLGTPSPGWDSALAINNVGQVVGSSSFYAALWTDGNVIDLNSFLDERSVNDGWKLAEATGINDDGWIVGKALNQQTNLTHAFLLTPVPEPETYALLLWGLGLLGLMTRSRAV